MNSFNPQQFVRFGPDAKVWIFTLARAVDRDEAALLSAKVDTFLAAWTAHKRELSSMSMVIDSQILLIVAESAASGCSIDALFTEVQSITTSLGLGLAPLGSIVLKGRDKLLRVLSRTEFKQAFQNKEFDLDAEVLNVAASTSAEIQSGIFQRLDASPYARLL